MIFVVKATKGDFPTKYLAVVNMFFELTDQELKVAAQFASIYSTLRENNMVEELAWRRTFDPYSKKIIMENLGFKTTNSIDQYILKLKEKGAIVTVTNDFGSYYTLHNLLIPKQEDITFRFNVSE